MIDDTANDGQGATLAAMSTLNKELADLKTGADQVRARSLYRMTNTVFQALECPSRDTWRSESSS